MRLSGTKTGAINQYRGLGNQLWDLAGNRPSLDLPFADNKSLVDATTGANLVDFTRASSGTYVDSEGVIQIASTDEPRFDHDPTTGESLGLLVEESRTNLRTFSEDFANAAYSVSTRLTVTADAIVAPNGTTTADKLVATLNNDQKYVSTTASVISSFPYAFGMFAKKGEYEVLQISVANTNFSGTLAYANFNLNTGTIVSSVDCTPSIQAIGDGWFRCSVIMAAATGTGANAFRFSPYASGNPGRLASYTGDGTSGIYVWGAQLEVGSFPTSYIPTTGAAATRAADVASISGSNFGGWYRQDQGTVFADATTNARYAGANTFPRIASLSDGTTSNRMDLLYRVLNNYTDAGYNIFDSGTSQATFDTNNERNGQSMAMAYAANNFAFTVGGTLANTDSSGTVPTVDRLSIGLRSGIDLRMSGTIRRLTYWPARLPNETLQTITQ